MTLALIGVNHKTASLVVRERVAIGRDELPGATRALAEAPGVQECMIVSTCNRVEILASVENPSVSLAGFLAQYFGLAPEEIHPYLYELHDLAVVRHLFRTAASLDSMVVGDAQILGQIKSSFAVAKEEGTISGQLEQLMQSAFAAAKKARTETGIGSNSVSIASVAVELAKRIFGSLEGRTAFLVGAGKMSEIAARHLVQQGIGTLLVTNRTQERAMRMAEEVRGRLTPRVVPFDQIYQAAAGADIILSSTGAPHYIFSPQHGASFLQQRRNRPMFFIDIAVPRDVDPAMNKLDGIFVYDIDDLQQVAASHLTEREREAVDAETLIEQEVERFEKRQLAVNAAPAIVALQQQAEAIRSGEIDRMHARLASLSPEQREAVEMLTHGLVNKFLHPPMQALKLAAREDDRARLEALCEVWSLPAGKADEDKTDKEEKKVVQQEAHR
jgi:glutamyl-tRNA reductase